jgi:hypothetical protein
MNNLINYINLNLKETPSKIKIFSSDISIEQTLKLDSFLSGKINDNIQIDQYKESRIGSFRNKCKTIKKVYEKAKNERLSIRINSVDNNWKELEEFAKLISLKLEIEVNCNAYFTPKETQALPEHKDTYPILVYQVSGLKKWFLDEYEIEPRAGEFLLLPRFSSHYAIGVEDSLHIAIGLYFPTYADLIKSYENTHHYNIDANDITKKEIEDFRKRFDKISIIELKRIYREQYLINKVNRLRYDVPGGKLRHKSKYRLNLSHIIYIKENYDSVELYNSKKIIKIRSKEGIALVRALLNLKTIEITNLEYTNDQVLNIKIIEELYRNFLIIEDNV